MQAMDEADIEDIAVTHYKSCLIPASSSCNLRSSDLIIAPVSSWSAEARLGLEVWFFYPAIPSASVFVVLIGGARMHLLK